MFYDLNLSIEFTKLFYNTIQTLKHKNQPNPRKNGLHMAYKLHGPCDGKKSTYQWAIGISLHLQHGHLTLNTKTKSNDILN